MRHLSEGVNPGIRSARSVDAHLLAAENLRKSALHEILHGLSMRLALPAAKRAAIVGKKEAESHGTRSYRPQSAR